MPDFDFFVSSIEDGLVEIVTAALGHEADPPGYLNEIGIYGGELDEDVLKRFVEELTPRFPLMLVNYGAGEDSMSPGTAVAFGEPRIWKHDCTFTVICCSDDARGESEQRRGVAGVYKMVADVRRLLAGRQLKKEGTLLTLEPLKPAGVQYLARLPQLTAYAVHFDTYFVWTEPDRRSEPLAVDQLIFEVTPLGEPSEPGGKPGVILE